MRRQAVVRDADPTDVEDLIVLWTEAGTGVDPAAGLVAGLVDEAPQALAQIAADPDQRMLVSEEGGRVVAAVHLQRAPISPMHVEHVVHTSFLLVLPACRRHGHARALLDAAAAWAEEKDIGHVTAIAASSSRDTNRFFARLGLATMATVRVAPTGRLRKRLNAGAAPRPGGRSVGEVLAARRSMRRRNAE